MAQYAILLFGKAPADPTDLTPEEQAAHARHGEDVEKVQNSMNSETGRLGGGRSRRRAGGEPL